MNEKHAEGAWDKTKGAVKDAPGDTKTQAEGKFDKAKGQVSVLADDMREAAREAQRQSNR